MGLAEAAVAEQADATPAPIHTGPAEVGAEAEACVHQHPALVARVAEHLSASISLQLIR